MGRLQGQHYGVGLLLQLAGLLPLRVGVRTIGSKMICRAAIETTAMLALTETTCMETSCMETTSTSSASTTSVTAPAIVVATTIVVVVTAGGRDLLHGGRLGGDSKFVGQLLQLCHKLVRIGRRGAGRSRSGRLWLGYLSHGHNLRFLCRWRST